MSKHFRWNPFATAAVVAVIAWTVSTPGYADAPGRTVANYGKLPLSFEANAGQADPQVKFLSRGKGYTLFLTRNQAILAPKHATSGAAVSMRLVGANPKGRVAGLSELPGKANYFIGNDPTKWRTGVPTYAKVKYEGVYKGVDLVYYGNQGRLEYDFVVAPAGDPGRIALAVKGQLKIGGNGDLLVATGAGDLRFQKPVAYQLTRTNGKDLVDAGYVLRRGNRVAFRVAVYDRTRPLIIDPVLSYSTYLGGNGFDENVGMAVDSAGNAYLTGETTSTNFPTVNSAQDENAGGFDAFVTKINPAGTSIVYSTYLGGSGFDGGYDVAVDSAGNAYVVGVTLSANFPTVHPIQATLNGGQDAFVAKLNPGGNGLVYSTFLGGSGSEFGIAIAIDNAGDAYVVGETTSSDFPTANPIQSSPKSYNWHGFASKFNAAGSALVYSTYLGGSGSDGALAVAVDGSSNVYVTGVTNSSDFPTVNPIQPTNIGSNNAFVSKINAAGSALVYSTYLGGTGTDYGFGIAVDGAGNAYLAGQTTSADFPVHKPIQSALKGSTDAFVTKINAAGSALVYSTYLGGDGSELVVYPKPIAVDAYGNAYITGATNSQDFPTVNPTQAAKAGGYDAFITKLNAAGSKLVYSSYLGGSGDEGGPGAAPPYVGVDAAGNIYVYGMTNSTDFPTVNPLQATNLGNYDLFLTKIGSALTISPKKLTFRTQVVGTTSASKAVTLTNIGSAAITISSITDTDPPEFPETNNCGSSVPVGASCAINVTFTPTASGTRTARIKITNSELGSPQTITLTGTGTDISLTPARLNFGSHKVGTTSAARTVTVTNVGTTTVTFTGPGIIIDGVDFPLQTNTCGTSIAAGASCTISIKFAPTATGARSATLDVNDDGGGSPQTVALSGTGT